MVLVNLNLISIVSLLTESIVLARSSIGFNKRSVFKRDLRNIMPDSRLDDRLISPRVLSLRAAPSLPGKRGTWAIIHRAATRWHEVATRSTPSPGPSASTGTPDVIPLDDLPPARAANSAGTPVRRPAPPATASRPP